LYWNEGISLIIRTEKEKRKKMKKGKTFDKDEQTTFYSLQFSMHESEKKQVSHYA
jgi:hypothetical protein